MAAPGLEKPARDKIRCPEVRHLLPPHAIANGLPHPPPASKRGMDQTRVFGFHLAKKNLNPPIAACATSPV
jgi:hypothetical protein